MQYLVAYGVPSIVILLSIPMILGRIPPNGVYGFRTPKTLSSPDIWYPANRMSGWFMCVAGLLSIGLNSVVLAISTEGPQRTQFRWLTAITLIPILASAVASFIYLRRI